MKITEKQIEDLIYNSPWILDERYIIPDIKGSQGQRGRQINLGKNNNRYIDLLLKDTRDNRPVIVELKKGELSRQDIGQILEYRALLISMNEEDKESWKSEFGQNYYSPKLVLIGHNASEDIMLTSNLAGVEIRAFNNEQPATIGFETFNELHTKLKEWDNFRNKGKRTLIERSEWVAGILEKVQEIIEDIDDVTTIVKIPEFSESKYYANNTSPFIDIPIFYKGEHFLGMYEYYDIELPFDDKVIYIDYYCLSNVIEDDNLFERATNDLKQFLFVNNIGFVEHGESNNPIMKIPREKLERNNELADIIKKLIQKGIELEEKYNKDE
jgi:hypothetical protein